jgi:hypothetical protein
MIKREIIITRRENKCGWLRQCGPSGLWLILTDKGIQHWHSNNLGWLFTLIATGGELSKSDKLPAGSLYFGFGFFFVFKVDVVDLFCKTATAAGTAAAAGTRRNDFLCPVVIWADVLLADVLAMIGSGQGQQR